MYSSVITKSTRCCVRNTDKLGLHTFCFVASKAHWLRRIHGVEGPTPVATVATSHTAPSALHARRPAVERVARCHPVVMVAIDKVVATPIPAICSGIKEKWSCYNFRESN